MLPHQNTRRLDGWVVGRRVPRAVVRLVSERMLLIGGRKASRQIILRKPIRKRLEP